MAEEEKKEQVKEEPAKGKEAGEGSKETASVGVLTWIVVAVVTVISAGAGFGVARIFAGSRVSEEDQAAVDPSKALEEKADAKDGESSSSETWYYELEPVVANLDEPKVTRYLRVSLILEISPDLLKTDGELLLEEKKPVLINWLSIYLASLSIEDARGDRNLRRIQLQILDAFNEKLFPNSKPEIRKILFKEFVIQ